MPGGHKEAPINGHLVPERKATEAERREGKARFIFPRFRSAPGRLFGRFLRRSPAIVLTLDETCTAVWDLVDGRRSLSRIGEIMRERFGEEVEPLRERLEALIGILEKNQLIVFRDPSSNLPE